MERARVISEILYNGPSYLLVLPVVFSYFIVLFGCIPLTTQVIIDQVCNGINSDDCESSEVSSKASTLLLASALALYLPSILTCGMYANIGDVYGRKYALFFPLVGMIFYTGGYLYINTYSPSWYFMGSVLTSLILGMCGGYVTFIMACMCYVSDCTATSPQIRKVAYSTAEATIFFPQVFAPVLSGIWARYHGFGIPLLIGFIITVAVMIYLITIPESLRETADSRSRKFKLDPLETFKHMIFLFSYKCEEGNSPLPWLGGAFLLFFTAIIGQTTIKIVYMKHMFDWDSGVIGVYDGVEGLVVSMSMLFIPGLFAHVFNMKFSVISWIQIGYAFRVIHFISVSIMRSTIGVFAVLSLLVMTGPIAPFTRTILSNSVPATDQARVFSAISAIELAGGMMGPIFGAIFSVLVKTSYPWLIFDLLGLITSISFFMILKVQTSPSIKQNLPMESSMQEAEKRSGSLSFPHISVSSDDFKVCEDHLQSLLDGFTEHNGRHTGSMIDDE